MSALKIGFFGHGPWAHRALRLVLNDPAFSVSFVATRRVGDDVLEQLAATAKLPFLKPEAINRSDCASQLAGFGADIFVSMSFDQIFRRPLMDAPRFGTINCHAGALPFYRGRNVLNWAIINGETRVGITVIRVDDGIDTGDILRQDFLAVGPDTTYGEILEQAHHACAETLVAALHDIRAGRAVRRRQTEIHPIGSYCGRRRAGDEWIDWRQSSQRVHDFVRGVNGPDLCAHALLDGQLVAIGRTKMIEGAPAYICTPGEVVGRESGSFIVKTGDTTVRVVEFGTVGPNGALVPGGALPKLGARFSLDPPKAHP
jgi:methionyl-tRNA formyltransferase